MIVTKNDGVVAAKRAIANYKGQISGLREERLALDKDQDAIRQDQQETLEQIAAGLIRSGDRESVSRIAEETGALHLISTLDDLEKQKIESIQRTEAISKDDEYINRELLTHPVTGEYSIQLKEAEETESAFKSEFDQFDFKEFKWLYGRDYHKVSDADRGGFQKFLRAITFSNQREKKAEEVALQKLKEPSFASCAEKFEKIQQALESAQEDVQKWKDKKEHILDMIEEKERLTRWVEDYPNECIQALRAQLVDHLDGCDLESLRDSIRPSAKVLIAKLHALGKKSDYVQDLQRYIDKEILDRENRVRSIDSVQRKWRRKPYGLLRGNKTRWLVDLPEMKRFGTEKRLRWSRTMRSNIGGYDHYGSYALLWGGAAGFLAYDAFAMGAAERMPYEGFSRGVIGELDDYRETHGMDRPDYSEYKEILSEESPEELEQYLEMDELPDESEMDQEDEAADAMAEDAEESESEEDEDIS